MKKITTLFLCLFAAYTANSQVLLSEDFESGFPSDFTLYDEDGLIVSPGIASFFPNAWNRIVYSGTTDYFAASTSLYVPAGQSDDWMVTPALNLTADMYLFWEGRSANDQVLESYEVLLSTTGNAVADFTTTLMTVTDETVAWNEHAVDLSAYTNSTVYIAFRNRSSNKYVLGIDDIVVRSVVALDAGIAELTLDDTYTRGDVLTVEGVITNSGSTTITSVNVSYSLNGNTPVTQAFTGLSIAPFTTYDFSMNKTISPTGPGLTSNLKVWVSKPNNGTDGDNTNDEINTTYFVNNGNTVSKGVLFEEFTTAPCQFCPDGAVVADYIKDNIPEAVVVGLHSCFSTDAMTTTESEALCNINISKAAPTAMVDRVVYEGEDDASFSRVPSTGTYTPATSPWTVRSQDRIALGAPVTVDIRGTYVNTSRAIDVDISAYFVDYVKPGNIGISLMIVEDSVTGTGSGYNQVNYYNAVSGHPYAGKGNPIVGFVHKHVLRDILPSTFGDQTVIPSNVSLWTEYKRNITATLSNSYNADRVSLVVVVSYAGPDFDEYEVLNAKEYKLSELIAVGINEESSVANTLNVFPNPSKDISNVSLDLVKSERVQLDIQDITGKVVISEDYGVMAKGNQLLRLNVSELANGLYFMNLKVGDEIVTRKITVSK